MNQEKLNKIIQKFADERYEDDVDDKQIDELIDYVKDEFLKFWYEFNEQFENYTQADNSRLVNRKLKEKLDEVAKENGVKAKRPSNNDEIIDYASYVYSSILAIKITEVVKTKLLDEASKSQALSDDVYHKDALEQGG